MEKADIVRMSSKGQVVIPQDLRQKLGLGAKSQLLVYRYADALIMKKLDVKDVEKRLGALYRRIDARTEKYGELNEADIQREMERYREEKRKQKAVSKMLDEEVQVDPKDPFLVRRPRGKSGLGDLSRKHDEYLYGKKKSRVSS